MHLAIELFGSLIDSSRWSKLRSVNVNNLLNRNYHFTFPVTTV
jgi:hypothetical protein